MEIVLREQISKNELERRWKAVREAMEKRGMDCLVMHNSNQYLGGYVRYFTDIPAATYGLSVIFPLDDEMTVISHGPNSPTPTRPSDLSYGVKAQITCPYIPTLNSTNTMDAEAAVKTFKEQNVKSLGFVAKALMPAFFYEYVREKLPEVDMHDATDLVDEIKVIKSEEEIKLIKKAVELHDKIFEATLELIRPGVMEYEISSEIQRLAICMGSEYGQNMVGSAPAGTPASMKPLRFQNRRLKYGDQICTLIEVNGPGGFYGELARTACIGVAPKSLLDVWYDAVEAQDRAAELMKPGTTPRELFDAHNKLLASNGYPAERRLFSHGQGYDMVERPSVRPEESMKIKTNMFMAIHPVLQTKTAHGFCCDNFVVTDSGTVRLSKTSREVFIV